MTGLWSGWCAMRSGGRYSRRLFDGTQLTQLPGNTRVAEADPSLPPLDEHAAQCCYGGRQSPETVET